MKGERNDREQIIAVAGCWGFIGRPAGGGALRGGLRGGAGGALFGAIIGGSKGAKRGAALGGGLGAIGGGIRSSENRDARYRYYYDACMRGEVR